MNKIIKSRGRSKKINKAGNKPTQKYERYYFADGIV